MLLLEGIDASGLGNWFAVSSHVSSKTALECKEHYFSIYIRQVDLDTKKLALSTFLASV